MLYTIGEVSKLFNLSISTLRYYEEKRMLEPQFIDQNNGYRYYSEHQLLTLDMIKFFRKVEMPINDIKKHMQTENSVDFLVNMIKKQENLLDEKLKEVLKAKANLNELNESMGSLLKYPKEQVVIKENESRKAIRFLGEIRDEEDRQEYFCGVVSYINKKYHDPYPFLSGKVSLKHVREGSHDYDYIQYYPREANFKKRKGKIEDEIKLNSKKISVDEIEIQKKNYISISFDLYWEQLDNCYEKILNYIDEKGLKVEESFDEMWVVPRVDENERVKIYGNIEIPIKI